MFSFRSFALALLLLGTAFISNAAVFSDASLTLYEKLIDVNKEWKHYPQYRDQLQNKAIFVSDVALIQKHLMLVTDHLKANQPADLSPDQKSARAEMLAILSQYAERGRFPINLYHSYRQPYFIDYKGTACAVGFLMLQTDAYHSVALEISKQNNYAYIHELAGNEALQNFARDYGFTIEELAWIQPGYAQAPPTSWQPVLNSIDGMINTMYTPDMESVLYIGGNFSNINGQLTRGIVQWDGQNFSNLSHGIDGSIFCLETLDEELVVGGQFNFTNSNKNYKNIARWDGSQWHTMSSDESVRINDLEIFQQEMYAAGLFIDSSNPQDTTGLRKWNGTDWEKPAFDVKGTVNDLFVEDGKLYLAGDFDEIDNTSGYQNVAIYTSGQGIRKIATGIPYPVNALIKFDTVLYAGTDFYSNATEGGVYLKYDNVSSWQSTAGAVSGWVVAGDSGKISGFSDANNQLAIYGNFYYSPMYGYYGYNVLTTNDSSQGAEGVAAGMNGSVNAVAQFQDQFLIGGSFTSVNNENHTGLASTYRKNEPDIYSSTSPSNFEAHEFLIFPNPVDQKLNIRLSDQSKGETHLQIFSAEGKNVKTLIAQQNTNYSLDVSNLSEGLYFVVLKNGEKRRGTQSFIISR